MLSSFLPCVSLLKFLKNPILEHPKLKLEASIGRPRSLVKGLSSNNEFDCNNSIYDDKALKVFELKWPILLQIKNISEYKAYSLSVSIYDDSKCFFIEDEISSDYPLFPYKSKNIEAKYFRKINSLAKNRSKCENDVFQDLMKVKVILRYKGRYFRTFYTFFNFHENKNEYSLGLYVKMNAYKERLNKIVFKLLRKFKTTV